MSTSTAQSVRDEDTFVDANAWVALFDASENLHESAREMWDILIASGCPITTSSWTAYEALTILNSRSHAAAMEFWEFVRDEQYGIELVDGCEFEAQALDMFTRFQDKTASVVDCVNFAVIRDRGCSQVFSFDRKDFGPAAGMFGFRLLP